MTPTPHACNAALAACGVATLLWVAGCSGVGGAASAGGSQTQLAEYWYIDEAHDGTPGRVLYSDIGGQRRPVDREVRWAGANGGCILYEATRANANIVYAMAHEKVPVAVARSDSRSAWYRAEGGLRRYKVRQSGAREFIDTEHLNGEELCRVASASEPFRDDWIGDGRPELADIEPERESFDTAATTRSGTTRLHTAIAAGELGLVDVLLKADYDVDVAGERGRTPLMAATGFASKTEIIRRVLESEPNINATDEAGMTALMHAVSRHAVEHARILIEKGADVTHRDAQGRTASDLAQASSSQMQQLIADAVRSQ